MNRVALPQTDSIRELATYWDTHDLTDHEHELEEVIEPIFDSPTVVSVPLDSDQVSKVKKLASTRGITVSALLKDWIGQQIGQL